MTQCLLVEVLWSDFAEHLTFPKNDHIAVVSRAALNVLTLGITSPAENTPRVPIRGVRVLLTSEAIKCMNPKPGISPVAIDPEVRHHRRHHQQPCSYPLPQPLIFRLLFIIIIFFFLLFHLISFITAILILSLLLLLT